MRTTPIAMLMLLASAAPAQEQSISLDKVPKPVLDAVRAKFPSAAVNAASTETEQGKTTYEVTIKDRGRTVEVTAMPDGTITTIERALGVQALPQAVRQAVDAKHAGATYRLAEEIFTVERGRETLAYYEVKVVTADGTTWEIEVAPDGKILQEEKDDEVSGGR